MPQVLNKRHKNSSTNSIYIGRPSKWGNPFTHMPDGKTIAKYRVGSRDEAVEAYRAWIMQQPALLADLDELAGKDLVCWCKPASCHGDVLLELANDK